MFDSMKIPNADDIASFSVPIHFSRFLFTTVSLRQRNPKRGASFTSSGKRKRRRRAKAGALDIGYGVACEILRRAESSRKLHSFQELLRRVAISGVLNLTAEIVSTSPGLAYTNADVLGNIKSVRFPTRHDRKIIFTRSISRAIAITHLFSLYVLSSLIEYADSLVDFQRIPPPRIREGDAGFVYRNFSIFNIASL